MDEQKKPDEFKIFVILGFVFVFALLYLVVDYLVLVVSYLEMIHDKMK